MTTGGRPPLLEASLGTVAVWCSGRPHGNVGDPVGDDPAAVADNRAAVAARAGLPDPTRWVWLRQVHGVAVHEAAAPETPPPEADAALTATRGLPLAIVTADCAPVVLACGGAVAVVHAGHRGLRAGIIEVAVARLRARASGEVRAFLGPCIRPARYEFGAEDLAAMVDAMGSEVAGITDEGKPALDIPAAVRVALDRAGVSGLDDCGICTASSDAYFSHRRDGATGRQLTVAVIS